MRAAFVLAFVLVAGAACGKPSSEGGSGGTTTSASGSSPAGSGAASSPATSAGSFASAAPSAAASAMAGAADASRAWLGSYKSAAAAMTLNDRYKKGHWSDTQSTAGIGEGPMTVAVDGATGRVTGALDGPLGPATLDGALVDGTLSATVARKDPTDRGFRGTLVATVAGDHLDGTMSLAPGQAGVVRTATFSLAPDGAGGAK
jgi:hypothetical protein